MKTSTELTRNFSPTIGRIAVAFALLCAIAGLAASPAFGQYNDGRDRGAQDRGRNDQRNQNDNRYRNDTRGRYDTRDRRGYRPEYQHPYRYSQPVYVPPTSYYYPEQRPGISLQSPGISLFFPLDLR